MTGSMKVCLAALVMAGVFGSRVAEAALVAPGGSVSVAGVAPADEKLAGTVLRDERTPFTVRAGDGVLFEGTFQDRVVRLTSDDTLVFAQSVHADRGFGRPIILDFLRRTGFGDFTVDADYLSSVGGGATPEKVYRPGSGDMLHFKFDDRMQPDTFSKLSFVKTDATGFDLTGDTEIEFIGAGGVSGAVRLRTARPSSETVGARPPAGRPVAIPLPAAAALFPLGAAAALWARRRMLRAARA